VPEVQFVLAGDGVELERLRQVAGGAGLKNIKFLGFVPMDLTPQLYAEADVLLVHLKDDPLFKITIPHKVFTYLAAGKPVLAAISGDAAALVESAGAGITCPPSNGEALASAVREFLAMTEDERAALGQRGRETACRSYSRPHLVEQIEAMCADVCSMPISSSRKMESHGA
jgi:glycosyltransferase involved in cell wall biosynthesis